MASVQKSQQHGSFGEKVSELFKGHRHQSSAATTQTQSTQCSSQTQKTTHANGTAAKCHGRTRREPKRNLLQKMKDGLSRHSSDSSSSSESDSDNEKCEKRKN